MHTRQSPRSFLSVHVALLIAIALVTAPGCTPPSERVAWTIRIFQSGSAVIVVFEQPKVVLKFDGVSDPDGELYDQVTVSGDTTESRGGGSDDVYRYQRVYRGGVATLALDDYEIEIVNKGQQILMDGDVIVEGPYGDDPKVVAIGKNGKLRPIELREWNEMIDDAFGKATSR
jgi:hypothetical protein